MAVEEGYVNTHTLPYAYGIYDFSQGNEDTR